MESTDIVEALRQLGLSGDEALVYTTLHALGPAPAGQVAETTKMSRPQTYRALDFLTARGIVVSDLSRPRIYTPVSVDGLLEHLRSQVETRAEELRLRAPELRTALSEAGFGGAKEPRGRTDFLRGRQVVLARANELYERARETIDLVVTHPGGLALARRFGGLDLLGRKAKTGVRVRLIVRPNPENATFMRERGPVEVFEMRELATSDTVICELVDRRQALVVLVVDPFAYPKSDPVVALITDAPNFLALQTTFFDALWAACARIPTSAPGEPTQENGPTRPRPSGATTSFNPTGTRKE